MTILPAKYARIRWDEDHAQKWVNEIFTWTNRETYLAWVDEWKAEVKERIIEIRHQKAIRRNKNHTIEDRGMANSHRQCLRIECANMYLLRGMAKKLSYQQKQARLAA
jgi:hypothetical protein